MKSLLVMKHGCLTMNLSEKAQNRSRVATGGNPPKNRKDKSISEEGTVHDILQLKLNHVTKTREEKKSVMGKYYRESVLAEVNRLYNRVRPNTIYSMRGIKRFRDD